MNKEDNMPSWADVKQNIRSANIVNSFHEGEVWWAAVGENIGVEINGKSDRYSRPIIVLKKFSPLGFLAVPLTSKPHEGSWFAEIEFQGKKEYACLAQARAMSVNRLYNKMGTLPQSDVDTVRTALIDLIEQLGDPK